MFEPSSSSPAASPPSPPSPPLLPLQIDNIGYKQGDTWLLRDISLCLKDPSKITVIMGANGAGKSLLLQILHGLLLPTCGSIYSLAKGNGEGGKKQRAGGPGGGSGLCLQNPVFLRRSVIGNLRVAARAAGLPKKNWQRAINDLLGWANLQNVGHQAARSLSGGERQIVNLLRALIAFPQLLLLDEPCANLDPRGVAEVEALLKKIIASEGEKKGEGGEGGVKICLVTHDVAQARRLADEVIFIHRGRLCEASDAKSFFSQPKSPEAQAYLKGELLP